MKEFYLQVMLKTIGSHQFLFIIIFQNILIQKKLKYSLKFHLYDYQYNEIHLPPNKKDMLKEINKLIKFHENIGKNAYFIFEICE